MKVLQLQPVTYSEEVIAIMNSPVDKYYKAPMPEIGQVVNVFNHIDIVQMTVVCIEGTELTLQDCCDYRHLATEWRWDESYGDIFITKVSMRHKSSAGWKPSCCKKCEKLCLKKVA